MARKKKKKKKGAGFNVSIHPMLGDSVKKININSPLFMP